MRILIFVILCLAVLIGCTQTGEEGSARGEHETFVTQNPTAEDILAQDTNADIFQWNGVVYVRASDIEWVQNTELTAGDLVGNIAKQYDQGLTFEDDMATMLPVGTELYEPEKRNGPILIAKYDEEEIRYLGLLEG